MAENVYLVAAGFVQKFPNKDAVVERDVNGGKVRDFTIKALGTQKLVRISVFLSDFPTFSVEDGDAVMAEGKYSASGDQGQFHNITAYKLAVNGVAIKKNAREVVNQGGGQQQQASQQSAPAGDSNPF